KFSHIRHTLSVTWCVSLRCDFVTRVQSQCEGDSGHTTSLERIGDHKNADNGVSHNRQSARRPAATKCVARPTLCANRNWPRHIGCISPAPMRWVRKSHIDPEHCPLLDSLLLRRIIRCLKPHQMRAAGVAAAIVACAVLNLAAPWFVKQIIDVAIPRRDPTLLWLCCLVMIAGPLVAGLVQVVQKYGAERIGQDVMFDLRSELYEHLHQMPFAFFTERRSGQAVSHVLNDVQGVGGVVSSTLVDVTQNAVVLCSTTMFMIALDWRLALMAVALLPLFIVPTRRVGRVRKLLKRRVQAGMGDLTSMLTEGLSVSGALLVKLFNTEALEVQRFQRKADEIRCLTLQQSLMGRWFKLLLGLFEAVAPAVVFAIGGFLVIT